MGFFWWLDAILGRESDSAKTTSEPVNLAKAFADWAKANPKQRQAVARISSALARSGYESLDDLKSATDAELLNVQGVGAFGLSLIRQIGGRYDED